jgi:hypothetical protein
LSQKVKLFHGTSVPSEVLLENGLKVRSCSEIRDEIIEKHKITDFEEQSGFFFDDECDKTNRNGKRSIYLTTDLRNAYEYARRAYEHGYGEFGELGNRMDMRICKCVGSGPSIISCERYWEENPHTNEENGIPNEACNHIWDRKPKDVTPIIMEVEVSIDDLNEKNLNLNKVWFEVSTATDISPNQIARIFSIRDAENEIPIPEAFRLRMRKL